MQNDVTDRELWDGLRKGDQQALSVLFDRYYRLLVTVGIKLCYDVEVAKDIANDVFFYLWNKRKSLNDVQNVRAYLTVACRNEVYRFLESKRKEREKSVSTQLTDHSEKSYEDFLISAQQDEEVRNQLQTYFRRLTPRQREYLELKFFQGFSYEQIAKHCGQTVKTVYNTTYEALKVLRESISF